LALPPTPPQSSSPLTLTAGSSFAVLIYVTDAYSNALLPSEAAAAAAGLAIVTSGPAGSAVANGTCAVTADGSGVQCATPALTVDGAYSILVAYNGSALANVAFAPIVVTGAAAVVSAAVVGAPYVYLGGSFTLNVTVADAYGNLVTAAAADEASYIIITGIGASDVAVCREVSSRRERGERPWWTNEMLMTASRSHYREMAERFPAWIPVPLYYFF